MRLLLATGAIVMGCLGMAPSASADHHFVVISEVYPGTSTDLDSEYVEVQMLAAGQNVFLSNGAEISFYEADGTLIIPTPDFASNPTSGSQRTVLMATDQAQTDFSVTADTEISNVDRMSPLGGAVCFTSATYAMDGIDCVSWGNFTGVVPNNSDPNEAAIPNGSSIARTKARGCATLMEFADDTNDSAADFAPATPSPRPSSVAPTETGCPNPGPTDPAGSCAGKTATKTGTNGANVIVGTPGKDVIAGLGGRDTIRGLAGNDFLCGGGGADKLIGGGGRDRLLGQAGRDTCKGGPKRDIARTCETKRTI